VVFVLSMGGKFSYQGSQSFIDEFNEKHADESIELTICLDGLGRGNLLYAHVSKSLAEGNAQHRFFQHLRNFADEKYHPVETVVKKINLSAEKLSWEHEIYNIRRIHALTLSHFNNHSDPLRTSLLDTRTALNFDVLERNARLIFNSVFAFIFDLDSSLCTHAKNVGSQCSLINNNSQKNNDGVSGERLRAWMDTVASRARPIGAQQQQKVSSSLSVSAELHEIVRRYAHQSHMSEVSSTNDFVFYDILEGRLTANVVKPAIFELFLASLIGIYIFTVYMLVLRAQPMLERCVSQLKKINHH